MAFKRNITRYNHSTGIYYCERVCTECNKVFEYEYGSGPVRRCVTCRGGVEPKSILIRNTPGMPNRTVVTTCNICGKKLPKEEIDIGAVNHRECFKIDVFKRRLGSWDKFVKENDVSDADVLREVLRNEVQNSRG